MMSRNLASLIVLAVLLVGCSADLPTTALNETDSVESLAKAVKSRGVVLWEGSSTDTFYLPCLGEEATGTAEFLWVTDIVDTPSGNSNQSGYIYSWDGTWVGHDSGEVWYLDDWRAKVQMHVRSDGSYHFIEPIKETYHNDSGERMQMTSIWKERDGEVDYHFKSCARMGRK